LNPEPLPLNLNLIMSCTGIFPYIEQAYNIFFIFDPYFIIL